MLKSFDEELPPKQTWIAVRYSVLDSERIVKTCNRGCCVIDPLFGSMILPRYWRLATDKEIASVDSLKTHDVNRNISLTLFKDFHGN